MGEPRILEDDSLVSEAQRFRSVEQTPFISPENVDSWNVVASFGNTHAHAINVQLRVVEGNKYEKGVIPQRLCLTHGRHCAMTR